MPCFEPNVLLISMPWAPVYEPSLGLAILKTQLVQAGIRARVRHAASFLLEYFKFDSYEAIAARHGLNDAVFTAVFEPELAPDQIAALDSFAHHTYRVAALKYRENTDSASLLNYVRKVRNEAIPQFLDDCLRLVEEVQPTMVGFTCMFDQSIASLALAKLIKQKYPEILIVFGGYALEDPVGLQLARCFPFVDGVVEGEGEDRIVPLARASVDRSLLPAIHGIHYRDANGAFQSNPRSGKTIALDESPDPDYDDFFADLEELRAKHSVEVTTTAIPVESSRGCWWGQVHHCTFCGIDDETMKYRSKSPENVERMLGRMVERYGDCHFRFSDYIMPRSYYKTLLPRLAADGGKYKLHWEIKANVKAEEIALMRQAGVEAVQPGIESFSTPVLRAMDKGVTGIQNVLTIRVLTEQDIQVNYNVLYGFPGDQPEWYEELLRNIPLLYHLPPPYSYVPVQMTRYAPLHSAPARFGIASPLEADRPYEIIFSAAFRNGIGFDLRDYAYVFATPYQFSPRCAELYDMVVYQCTHWVEMHAQREIWLSYEIDDRGVTYRDSRYREAGEVMSFGLLHARIQQRVADRIVSVEELCAELSEVSAEEIAQALEELERSRLLYREANRVLGLAMPVNCYERWRARAAVLDRELAPA
jgi:ribosomal peptide maturation radical SAM protein 1